ncbi:MAG: rod shape-determining protein RodA [Pseudomonadota bacterium]
MQRSQKTKNDFDGTALSLGTEIRESNQHYTRILGGIFALIVILGIFNLYSATDGNAFFYSQIRNAGLGIVLFFIFGWLIPPRTLNTYAYWIFGAVCILLAIVLVVGDVAGGSQRWIEIAGFRGQPSELAKITAALVTARFFYTNKLRTAYKLSDLWLLGAMIGAIFGLIFPQPDLGTAGICVLIAACQIAFVQVDRRSLIIVASTGLILAIVAWFGLLHDYQKLRIMNLFNPELDPGGSGYHSLQSLVAVGSGRITGKGFMQGTQTQLQFLPERHTDFIFSVFAEEHGFIGAVVAFVLFGALSYVALEIARQAKDSFTSLLAVGLTAFLFLEFVINAAMVLGMFPVVGIPLPLFSYGGSAYLSVCIALGALIAIDRENLGLFRKNKPFTTRFGAKAAQNLAPSKGI